MSPVDLRAKTEEWQRRLWVTVSGLLAFETLTGLAIFLLPFSVPNQVSVLLHTMAGLVFVLPYVWYQVRHWRLYRTRQMTHVKLTGYFSMVAAAVLVVSGLVLSYQALLQTRISYAWDLIHIIATFALIASVLPHVGALVYYATRGRKVEAQDLRLAQRRLGLRTAYITGGLVGVTVLAAFAYRPVRLVNRLPADYSFLYGPDRPFAPSLARTTTLQAFDARSMGGSKSCGTPGCHEEIYKEWSVSAHRYSAMDVGFRAIQTTMGNQNGPESTRYCAGCHDPISLFAGTKNLYRDELTNPIGRDEGVSCVVCHSIKETDVKGNASYVIAQPARYMFELADGTVAPTGARRLVRDFLIRAYPREHVRTLQHRLFKSPEFCAACHKQFIDEEINQVGWVQLQNQYDNWRKSRWNDSTNASKTIECRECHMPLLKSSDPAAGDDLDYNRDAGDGKHRSHRFLAANQFMPLALKLEGAEEHVRLTEQWLRGEYDIPEIADKWRTGPAVPIELVAPSEVRPGERVGLQVLITNNKVGHDYPTGPLDIIQSWVEIEARDQDGNVVFSSGRRDERHFIEPGSFIFKAEPVDQYGKLIDRHNLWEMVGVRYRRALFPGQSDRAEFAFLCPATVARTTPAETDGESRMETFTFRAPRRITRLDVSAKLMYRKIDQFLLNFLFGDTAGLTAPVTVLSEDAKSIAVTSGGGS
ncbi:MAG TPA: multiheme c-type cytochrome [Gemmatimonadales bacterium]|nr:multiheme c-type cytochrome [Gemmatimonadales bacterium]